MAAKVVPITQSAKAEPERNQPETDAESQQPRAGWDPYEVWRTRVLMPRLEESEPKPAMPSSRFWHPVLDRLRRRRKA